MFFWVGEQLIQNIELARCNWDLYAVHFGGDRIGVQNQIANGQLTFHFNVGTAQKGTHPHFQFSQFHRLDHIIINAQLEPFLLGG